MRIDYETMPEKAGGLRGLAIGYGFNLDFRQAIGDAARRAGIRDIYKNPIDFLNFVLNEYVYTEDPFLEMYQIPTGMLLTFLGDCDDIVLFLAALFQVLRVPNEIEFILYPDGGGHVLIYAELEGATYLLDFANGQDRADFRQVNKIIDPGFNDRLTRETINHLT